MSEVFVSTDERHACPRGVIGSTVGAYPRGTGSNPVEGNGHFFPSCRQLYLSSFADTHTHTHTHGTRHTKKKKKNPAHKNVKGGGSNKPSPSCAGTSQPKSCLPNQDPGRNHLSTQITSA